MKKALLALVLILGYFGHSQNNQNYRRYGKRTTAQINAIDTTRTDVIYEAYNDDLGILVINRRNNEGWVPLITSIGSGTPQTLALSGTNNTTLGISDGNTILLPVLSNANQTITANRIIEVPSGNLDTYLTFRGGGTTMMEIGTSPSAEGYLAIGNFIYGQGGNFWAAPTPVFARSTEPVGSADGDLYYNTTSNTYFGYDVALASWVAIGGGSGGSDSGQSAVYRSGTSKTWDLSDFVEGGTLNSRKILHDFTTNETITLQSGLGQTGRVLANIARLGTGADTLNILKGTATLIANKQVVTTDGVRVIGNYDNIVSQLLPDGTIQVSTDATIVGYDVALYQGNNAADPVNEINGFANTTSENGTSTSSIDFAQNGTYSLKFEANSTTTGRHFYQTQNIAIGDVVTGTMYIYRDSATDPSSNIFVGALAADGWNANSLTTIDNTGINAWIAVNFTATATIANPPLRSYATSIAAGNIWYTDNISYTIN